MGTSFDLVADTHYFGTGTIFTGTFLGGFSPDGAFLGFAVGALAAGGDAFFAEKLLGCGEIATGFGEGFFTIHHSRVGFFAEFFDKVC